MSDESEDRDTRPMADILSDTMHRIDAKLAGHANSPRWQRTSKLLAEMRDADPALYAQVINNERFATALGELAALADGGAV